MPQTFTHGGRRISIHDNVTPDDFIDILSRETALPPALPEVAAADRRFPFTGETLPSVAAPRPGMFDDLVPPLPLGFVLDTPAAPPLPPGYTLDKPGMFDDLIPPNGAQVARTPVTDPALLAQLNGTPAAGPKLIPVDHDPFAQFADAPPAKNSGLPPGYVIQPPAGRKLIPVDHDPFAQFADAPSASNGLTPGGVPIAPSGRPRVNIGGSPPTPPSNTGPTALHSLAVGAQGVGKGVADIVTGPFDLAAGLQNAISGLVNKFAGTNIPMATPASKMVERVAEPYAIPESEMSRGEKLGYNVNKFGTQGLGMGTMLAARAPAVMASTTRAPTVGGRVAETLSRPYKDAPARTVVGDTIGGIGAGAAVDAVDNFIPDNAVTGGTTTKQVANALAPLVGGIGANSVQAAAEGLGGLIRNAATRAFSSAPSEIPLRANKTAYSVPDIDRAATQMQASVTGAPKVVARDIRENAGELRQPVQSGEKPVDASALPTTGLLSRDPGLVTLEAGSRSKSAPEFIKRDQSTKEAAAERIDGLRDPEGDIAAVFRRAQAAQGERLAPAQQAVAEVESVIGDAARWRQEQGAEFTPVANTSAKARASGRLDKAIVDDDYVPARAEKNRQFDSAPGRTEQLPADDVFAAIDRVRAGINRLGPAADQMPAEFIQRLDRLRPRHVEAEGPVPPGEAPPTFNEGGPGTALGGDLANLRKYLNTAQQKAQQAGNFDLADNVSQLRTAINRTINEAPGYAEANANYAQFADRFRPGRGDAMAEFTKKLDRGGNVDGMPNRSSTPPSETAGRFLTIGETAQALQRVLQGAPNAAAGQAAVRDYMRSDLAMKALNPDGTVNPIRAAAWSRHNAAVLAKFPTLEREFDTIALAARRGQQLSADAQEGLAQARATLKATQAQIDNSAVGTLLHEDPRDVANGLLSGGYSSEARLDEILAMVKNDAPAKRGWKAAVAEVLADRVQGSRQVGETPEVQFARLSKEFKDNEALLAKTFSPDEMNSLRQGHKLLSYFKEAEKRGTVGSDTADKWNIPTWAQLAVRHVKGDLAGGGLIKRFKLLLEQLPTNRQSADEIVQMAWFNPDVAAYLLERPIRNANVPAYNINLRRLIAADNVARESGPSDDR
jgi:hypothetical protein